MQHTNDDIDDLLRNAAENYPLKINGADWDGVAGRLLGAEGDDLRARLVSMPFVRSSKRYRYLLLLLLLPVGYIALKYSGLKVGSGTRPSRQAAVKADSGQEHGAAPKDENKAGDNGIATSALTQNSVAASGVKGVKSPENNVGSQTGGAKNDKAQLAMQARNLSSVDKPLDDGNKPNVPGLKNLSILERVMGKNANIVKGEVPFVPYVINEGARPPVFNVAPANISVDNSIIVPHTGNPDEAPLVQQPSVGGGKAAEPVAAAPAGKSGAGDPNWIIHPMKVKRFYIGAFVAPDYTTVKYQPGSKIGFTLGGLFGYNFAKNFDVELGISTDKKYYTSSGKYFNTKLTWLNSWGTVLALSGYASLTEFPLNVKYNFKQNKDGNFFISAGVVSSIVHDEDYDYTLDKNGLVYTRHKSTRIATYNIFSNVSLSGGYESSLGGNWNFRIEPYYRMPIKGTGIGGLPITSIGLNIGITKKIK